MTSTTLTVAVNEKTALIVYQHFNYTVFKAY